MIPIVNYKFRRTKLKMNYLRAWFGVLQVASTLSNLNQDKGRSFKQGLAVNWSCMLDSQKFSQNRSVLNHLPALPCISTLNVKPQSKDGEFDFTSLISDVLKFIFTIGFIACIYCIFNKFFTEASIYSCVSHKSRGLPRRFSLSTKVSAPPASALQK